MTIHQLKSGTLIISNHYAPNDLVFGKMKQFEVHRDEINHTASAAFRNEQDALEWLSK